ncbi:hypothetical protein ACEQPO_18805 [Bacillus sp. SL00103]
MYKRPSLKPLWELRVFERYVELNRKDGPARSGGYMIKTDKK